MRHFARLTSALFGISLLVVTAGLLVGWLLPASVLAIDPLRRGSRDLALLDYGRRLIAPLTHSAAYERSPAWSPDGAQLAYLAVSDGQQTLWLMQANGFGRRALITSAAGDPDTAALAWSPDGRALAFTAQVSDPARQAIFVLDLETGQQRQITISGINASAPAWSPDGRALAFSWSPVANQEIFVADVNALDLPISTTHVLRRLTSDPGLDSMPAWSPDGRSIAFFSTRDGDSNIYVIDLASGGLQRVTSDPARDTAPFWSPEGHLLFRSYRAQEWAIYRAGSPCGEGGCASERLLSGDFNAAWRP
jgi:TolB protein